MCCTFRDQLNWMQHRFCLACTFTFWEINACKAKIHPEFVLAKAQTELSQLKSILKRMSSTFSPHFFHHSFHESSRLLTWCPAVPAVHVGTFHPLMAALSAGRRSLKRAPTRPGARAGTVWNRVDRGPGPCYSEQFGVAVGKRRWYVRCFFLHGIYGDWCPVGIYERIVYKVVDMEKNLWKHGMGSICKVASSPFETWPRSSSAHGHFLKQSPPMNKAQPMRLNCSSERFFFTASGARDVSWIKSPQHLVAARCHQTATARCLFQHVMENVKDPLSVDTRNFGSSEFWS